MYATLQSIDTRGVSRTTAVVPEVHQPVRAGKVLLISVESNQSSAEHKKVVGRVSFSPVRANP